jgi:hypothetical protein
MEYKMDPVNSYADRLYLFWHAYEEEANSLLEKWHNDPKRIKAANDSAGGSGNPLYDSFLDTWGNGPFESDSVPLERKSYFAALGFVSRWLRDRCLGVLATDPKNPKLAVVDESGKPMLALNKSDKDARDKVADLTNVFKGELDGLDKVDTTTEDVARGEDRYLRALRRMMLIETDCFKTQKYFLENGRVPPDSRVAA